MPGRRRTSLMDCLLVICLVAVQLSGGAEAASTHAVAVTFDDSEGIFSAADKALIKAIVRQTGAEAGLASRSSRRYPRVGGAPGQGSGFGRRCHRAG